MRRLTLLFMCSLLVSTGWVGPGLMPAPVAAAVLPTGFYEETLATATAFQTTAFAFVPDGRILIAEKPGIVRVYKNGALLPTPLLDIQGRVNQYEDRGLLGIAVDPDFPINGFIYLTYTYEHLGDVHSPAARTVRISRFTVTGDTAASASELVIVGTVTPASGTCNDVPNQDCIPSDGTSHSGGNLKFASDGSIFASIGDGSDYNQVNDDALRAQSEDWLDGKILRFTKDGKGRPANPFWNGNPDANRSKVWAKGVRNAFRFNLRPGTDLPYVGDVGWDTWEEINVATPGANLGWPCYEGPNQQPNYAATAQCQALYTQGTGAVKAPLYTYPHNGSSASIVGGTFYTGTSYPVEYQGAFFFGDYSNDFIKYLKVDADQNLVAGSVSDFATDNGGAVDIESGPGGDLFYLSIVTGQLHRIRYGTPPPPPPVSTGYLGSGWVSATNGYGPVEVNRSNGGEGGNDGGTITIGGVAFTRGLGTHAAADIRYSLGTGCDYFTAKIGVDDEVGNLGSVIFKVFGDDALTPLYTSPLLTGADAARTITVPMTGQTTLELKVEDGGDSNESDHADWADAQCTANQPPQVTIAQPTNNATYRIGEAIAYSGSAVDPEGGPVILSWQLITRHCPGGNCHAHPTQLNGQSGTFVVSDHDDETHLELLLTATDSAGQQNTASVSLYPQQATLAVNTAPAGLNVVYGGKAPAQTLSQQIDIGGSRTISAPSPQVVNGTTYTFVRWSDGNTSQQRTIQMGAEGVTLTAVFTAPAPVPSPTPTFGDVTPATTGAVEAIGELAARGIIKGCDPGATPPLFCPTDPTLRAQMAALIVRAMGWGAENPANPFADRNGVDDELWRAVAILANRQIAKGYGDGTYGTTDPVLNAQVISFITRAMVARGYWQAQPDDGAVYPNVPAGSGHRQDLVTYVHYAGVVRGTANATDNFIGWDAVSSRAYFAFALWQALQSYYGPGLVP